LAIVGQALKFTLTVRLVVAVFCGTLIALKQLDDWISVRHGMTDEEVFGPTPEAANQQLAKCMLQQLQGKPQGAGPYAYIICSKWTVKEPGLPGPQRLRTSHLPATAGCG
jgi:hypothetical protein